MRSDLSPVLHLLDRLDGSLAPPPVSRASADLQYRTDVRRGFTCAAVAADRTNRGGVSFSHLRFDVLFGIPFSQHSRSMERWQL